MGSNPTPSATSPKILAGLPRNRQAESVERLTNQTIPEAQRGLHATVERAGRFLDSFKGDELVMTIGDKTYTGRADIANALDHSVDNRMGQMVYDNLFHNRMVKDIALLSFRAYGWQLGKYREGLGAVVDTVRAAGKLAHGQRPEFTHRMAYAIALPVMVGTIGGILHYLFTGQPPQSALDYFQPATGEKDRNDNPVRLNLPSYLKDALSYSPHPTNSRFT